jgi:DNA-binding MarR family transcriptional regulator
MDKSKAAEHIMDLFIKAVHRYNAMEKVPRKVGLTGKLYHSERHLLDKIKDIPGLNISEFAEAVGMTKGAVSQFVKKLEKKGLVERYKKETNEKEIFLKLTEDGLRIYSEHRKRNEETIKPLLDEIQQHSDEQIQFFIDMLAWVNSYLEKSRKQME